MGIITTTLAAIASAAALAVGSLGMLSSEPIQSAPTMIKFDPSQRHLMDDPSRVIVVNWHRQKGKDFTAAAKAVRHALRTGQTWYIVSLTQRQADATFDKCKRCAKAIIEMLKLAGTYEEMPPVEIEQYDRELKQSFVFLAREIRLPNGGRVVSLPGRDPDTLAGLTGNVIFTEFGLFPNGGYDHWRVVFPLTTRGFCCIVISTPRGKNTKFYELCVNDTGAYSVHFCDIYKSIAVDGFVLRDNDGNPTDIETFKRLYGDAAGFDREYGCLFSGDSSALITWAEIERAAALPVPASKLGKPLKARFVRFDKAEAGDHADTIASLLAMVKGERLAIGWDVARTGDVSAVTVNVLRHGQPSHLAIVVAMIDCEFAFMRGIAYAFMDQSPLNVGSGDATGLGMESNESLHKKFGDRWMPHTFTTSGKEEVASALQTACSDGTQTLPPLNGELKLVAVDVYAVQRDASGSRVIISETDNPLLDESHCDIAYSLGLARLAGSRNILIPVPDAQRHKPRGM